MNKKSLLGLLLFASLVIAILFFSATYLTDRAGKAEPYGTISTAQEEPSKGNKASTNTSDNALKNTPDNTVESKAGDTMISPEDAGTTVEVTGPAVAGANSVTYPSSAGSGTPSHTSTSSEEVAGTFSTSMKGNKAPELIIDSTKVDYQAFIPKMIRDSELEAALDINNPDLSVEAKSAILFDADTKKVLFYKDAVQARFPASTAKLLTSLVALKNCTVDEQVTIGDEITMIGAGSTRAFLQQGQKLTIHNLLAAMLLPSGNDAAYAVAAYVGRKSLDNPEATKEDAIAEFVRLMNEEAASLGVKNSCFKSPDGYDAIGQYTTAYDMGLIGVAAANNSDIIDVTQQSSSRNIFISGEDVTWDSTNKLITKYSGQYYSHAIGLKTGTSTMAGRCIIAAAEYNGKKVVCVIMDSTSAGRWEDAIKLLKYGLD